MDIKQLLASIEVEHEATLMRQRKAKAEVELILDTARQEGRSSLSEEESTRTDKLFENIELAKVQENGIKDKLARAKKIEAEEAEFDARAHDVTPTPAARKMPKYDEVARVGNEERTYHKGNDPRGQGFLRDVCRQFLYNDVQAQSRLSHHMQEERVERANYMERAPGDIGTSGLGGLVVPQYLIDMVAPMAAAMRPFADVCVNHQLPAQGMTVYIPSITTATSAALQATQLTAVSTTSIGETDVTIAVQTAAGSQNVSRKAIDRGSGIDEVVLQDLMNRYNTVLDSTLLNGTTHGLSTIALGTLGAYADTQPTGAKLYPKLLAAASGVQATLLAMGFPTHAVMHSRRWYWLAKEMTSTWPLINSQGIPPYSAGTLDPGAKYNKGIRGVLPNGMLVVVDNNVTTTATSNQDEIYVVPQAECHLWEDGGAPVFIRAEQPNAAALGVLLVVYGYFAYTFERYPSGAFQKIAGTGLATPVF